MSCPTLLGNYWDVAVEYADDDGAISGFAVQQAHEDWQAGELDTFDMQGMERLFEEECELANGVSVADVDAMDEGGLEIRSVIEVTTSGTAPVDVTVDVTLTGGAGGTGVSETETLLAARESAEIEVRFEVPLGGDYEVCADVIEVTPA